MVKLPKGTPAGVIMSAAAPLAIKVVTQVADAALSDEGKQWMKDHAPKSKTQSLAARIDETVQLAESMSNGNRRWAASADQAAAWQMRAVALRDRSRIPVSKEKKKQHRAAIESDLDALHAEMTAALS